MATQISIDHIQSLGGVPRAFAAGNIICDYDSDAPRLLFIQDGWAASSKMLPNGTRISVDAFVDEHALSRVLRAMKGAL